MDVGATGLGESLWTSPPLPDPTAPVELLVNQWNPAKAFLWLRAGHPAWLDPDIQDFQARAAFLELGINPSGLSNAWHRRAQPDWEALTRPIPALPANPGETWPDMAMEMEASAAGVLAVLVSLGWNGFKPFVPEPGQPFHQPEKLRSLWAVELLMGQIGTTRISGPWRQALVDQMFRSPHCPDLETLRRRRVCKFKNNPPISWAQACAKYQEWVGMRALLDHGLGSEMKLPSGECVSTLCPEATAARGLRAHLMSHALPPANVMAYRFRM